MNHIFDRVFVINLKRDRDKRLQTKKLLSDMGVKATYVDAVDGRNLVSEIISKETSSLCSMTCSSSVIGCALSHKNIWKYIVSNGLQNALILEDDVVFTDNWSEIVPKAFKELPYDWDLFYLGFQKSLDMIDYSSRYSNYLYIPRFIVGTHAYAVSNQGCIKMLQLISNITHHIDFTLSMNLKKIKAFCCYPLVAYQQDMDQSNIAIKIPVMLNRLLNIKINPYNDLDGRTISWFLSEVQFVLGTDMLPINLWFVVFIVFGLLQYQVALGLLLIDYGYLTFYKQNIENPVGYTYLLIAILVGYILRKKYFDISR